MPAKRELSGSEEFIAWIGGRLAAVDADAPVDPISNGVRRVAFELFTALEAGDFSIPDLARHAKTIGDSAFAQRAANLRAAHADAAPIAAAVRQAFAGATEFQEFRERAECTRAGAVFTAHPTFALSATQRAVMGALASRSDDQALLLDRLSAATHAPDVELTLAAEHAAARYAIDRARVAMNSVNTTILTMARERFPDTWTDINPGLINLATWVGYDIDGRTDIRWSETFRIRLAEKAAQLSYYADHISSIPSAPEGTEKLAARLREAAGLAAQQADSFGGELENPAEITNAANMLTSDSPGRMTSIAPVIQDLNDLIQRADSDATKLALCTLRAEMTSSGLGVARIHLRVNAAQVRSAVRADLGIDGQRHFADRTTFEEVVKRAAATKGRRINIASIFLEQMTARRQLMLCAQFLKHIDADIPIRFLIAECEAPATIIGAIYLARLYGVESQIDISPLFETPDALERGGRFMERLLSEPEYRKYVSNRGRLTIQIGFSDSGRFMGQVAANLAIERLQILLARAMMESGVQDVQALIFNTHGESMGRGAFPGSLQERFDYLMTPWARARFSRDGISVIAEASFQGGDGYLHFETQELANSTISAFLAWSCAEVSTPIRDQFYVDINYSWDFYRSIKGWQEQLFEDPFYHTAISAFAGNFLFTTGSRKTRRQSGSTTQGPRALRAIPHNAILQQLAIPVNVVGGIGTAAAKEPERFAIHVRDSSRMRQVMQIAGYARDHSSVPVLRAYAGLYEPAFWITLAAQLGDGALSRASESVAGALAETGVAVEMEALANHLGGDLLSFDRAQRLLDGGSQDKSSNHISQSLLALHAMRQALIMKAFVIVAELPPFSSRHDLTKEALLQMAFSLRLGELADQVEQIFPAVAPRTDDFVGMEEPRDDGDISMRGYPEIHEHSVKPLRAIDFEIRRIGGALAHYYGAYG